MRQWTQAFIIKNFYRRPQLFFRRRGRLRDIYIDDLGNFYKGLNFV